MAIISLEERLRTAFRNACSFWWTLLCLGFFIAGCATILEEPDAEANESKKQAVTEEESKGESIAAFEDYPVAPFEGNSLYQLLVAEIAGYRSLYDIALDNYVLTAEQTLDAGVAARATRMALYLKDDGAALRSVKIWTQTEPGNLTAHRHAVDLLVKANRYEEAIYHMEQVKNLGGSARFEVFAYRAAGLSRNKRLALLALLEEVSARYPRDDRLKFSKGILLQELGRYENALEIADDILETNLDINVIILKLTALSEMGRLDDARVFITSQVEAAPANRRLRLVFARLLFEAGDLDKARIQYESVLDKSPNDGDVLFALALIAMEQKNDAEAKRYLERMVRWNRRAGEAHYYLGTIAERSMDPNAALEHYRLTGNGREYVPAQARIGSLLVKDGLWDDAREHLNRARYQQPDKAQQLIMVEAQLLTERGLESDVFDFLNTAIVEDPKNIELLYFRAMTGQRFGYLAILESDLRRIIEIDPDNADALNALGYTLTDQTDRHEEALELIQKALTIKPDEAAFIDSMGWVQYRLQNYESAIMHLRKALGLFQNDEVAAHLGEVLWVVGEKAEAVEIWNQALEWAPESEIIKAVMQRFREE